MILINKYELNSIKNELKLCKVCYKVNMLNLHLNKLKIENIVKYFSIAIKEPHRKV